MGSHFPLVSIITVALNSEKHIEAAIQSVLAQTYPHLEYIIIDGGSRDGTVPIIKRYADKISSWQSEPDKGIADAFNKGIRHSRGDIIGILNSDDWYSATTVATVVERYRQTQPPAVFHGDMSLYLKDNPYLIVSPGKDPERMREGMIYNHPTCFVTKDCYAQWGLFNEKYGLAMDYDLLLRFYLKGAAFHYIPEVLTHMRCHGESHQQAVKGLRESCAISIASGYPAYKAIPIFGLKAVKHMIKDVIGHDNFLLQQRRKILGLARVPEERP